jgi:signal peptidase II
MAEILLSKKQRVFWVLGIMAPTIISDQLTKVLARDSLSGVLLSYLGDTIRLQRTENAGAFLSLGAELDPTSRLLIFTVGIGVFLIVGVWILIQRTSMNRWNTVSMSLIIAGGIGNLIDRAVKGSVTDFMNVGIGWLRTGVFNIADMAIMAGIFAMLWSSFRAPSDPLPRG